MRTVLNGKAELACPHGGPITVTATQTVLQAGGAPALLVGDLTSAVVACPQKPPAVDICTAVVTVSPAATATVLAVGGKPVTVDSGDKPPGATNIGPFKINKPGQTVLKAK